MQIKRRRLSASWVCLLWVVAFLSNGCDYPDTVCDGLEISAFFMSPVIRENLRLDFVGISIPDDYVLHVDDILVVDHCSLQGYDNQLTSGEILVFIDEGVLRDGQVHVELESCEDGIPEEPIGVDETIALTSQYVIDEYGGTCGPRSSYSYTFYRGLISR